MCSLLTFRGRPDEQGDGHEGKGGETHGVRGGGGVGRWKERGWRKNKRWNERLVTDAGPWWLPPKPTPTVVGPLSVAPLSVGGRPPSPASRTLSCQGGDGGSPRGEARVNSLHTQLPSPPSHLRPPLSPKPAGRALALGRACAPGGGGGRGGRAGGSAHTHARTRTHAHARPRPLSPPPSPPPPPLPHALSMPVGTKAAFRTATSPPERAGRVPTTSASWAPNRTRGAMVADLM